jgi:hypothetical protein
MIDIQTCHFSFIWNYKNYQTCLGSKFDKFIGQMWPKEKILFMSKIKGWNLILFILVRVEQPFAI